MSESAEPKLPVSPFPVVSGGESVDRKVTWALEIRTEGKPWLIFGTPTEDRKALARTQKFRRDNYPDEQHRVIVSVVVRFVETTDDDKM